MYKTLNMQSEQNINLDSLEQTVSGKYYWVRTDVGREIAFKRDSGFWEMHGVDCLEDCNEAILEVYGEVVDVRNLNDCK